MSDVIDELNRELFDLTNWIPEHHNIVDEDGSVTSNSPNYSLSYLLAKLPLDNRYTWQLEPRECHLFDRKTLARYKGMGDTPRDAVAKLCIELVKQSILKPDTTPIGGDQEREDG